MIRANSKQLWEKQFLITSPEGTTMGSSSRKRFWLACHHAALQRETVYMIYLAFLEPHAASVLQNYLRPHHSFFLLWQSTKRKNTGHSMTH